MKKTLLSYFLLSLFLVFYTSVTQFSHTHIINGVTIVHSHPYSPGTDGSPVNHQHTPKAVSLIQLISDFTAIPIAAFILSLFVSFLYKITANPDEDSIIPVRMCVCSLRAPPQSC